MYKLYIKSNQIKKEKKRIFIPEIYIEKTLNLKKSIL